MRIGLLAAMQQEVATLHEDLHLKSHETHAERTYHFGQYG